MTNLDLPSSTGSASKLLIVYYHSPIPETSRDREREIRKEREREREREKKREREREGLLSRFAGGRNINFRDDCPLVPPGRR